MQGREPNNPRVPGTIKSIKLPDDCWEYLKKSNLSYGETIKMLVLQEKSKKVYFESKHLLRFSNVVGDHIESSHPSCIILPSGEKVYTDYDARQDALIAVYESGKTSSKSKYTNLHKDVEFTILREWENDLTTSGSIIRWKVPKGSKFVWYEWIYGEMSKNEIDSKVV